MGVVRKQSFISSIVIYFGFIIGAFNTVILLPKYFTTEQVGLTRIFIDFSVLFSSLATMGIMSSFIKFFPLYNHHLKPKENDFPFIVSIVTIIGGIIFAICALLFKPWMIEHFGHNSPLFIQYYDCIFPITLFFLFYQVLESFCWMIKQTIQTNFVKEVVVRVYTLLIIILFICKIISINTFFKLYVWMYLPGVIYLLYIIRKEGSLRFIPKISTLTKRLKTKIRTFTMFHFTGQIIGVFQATLDGIFIAGLHGLTQTAVYSIAMYFVAVMEIPQRAMTGIASATISESWKNRDINNIKAIYKKSSINLLLAGILIFGLIYPNMDNVGRFIPEYAGAKAVVLIAGIGKLLDMGMGMNSQILGLSRYWKFDFFTNVFLIFIAIPLNYFCIKQFGIIGAPIGTLMAQALYNGIRFIFLWKLFHIQPFTFKTGIAVILGIISVWITLQIPYLGNMFVDAIARAAGFAILFTIPVIGLKISPDINELILNLFKKLKKESN